MECLGKDLWKGRCSIQPIIPWRVMRLLKKKFFLNLVGGVGENIPGLYDPPGRSWMVVSKEVYTHNVVQVTRTTMVVALQLLPDLFRGSVHDSTLFFFVLKWKNKKRTETFFRHAIKLYYISKTSIQKGWKHLNTHSGKYTV